MDKLLKAANRCEFDIIMAWSVDRLGRSLQHLVGFLDDIHAKGGDLYLTQQNIDTSTPPGKAMFQMAGVFAEFERSIIQERIRAGLERARETGEGSQGVTPCRGAYPPQKDRGAGYPEDSPKEVGVGTSVVQRVLKAA